MSTTIDDLTILTVPFVQKDLAKAAGARWDRTKGTWYAPPGADLEPLAPWLKSQEPTRPAAPLDPRVEFADALRAQGLKLTALPEMDGRLHRVPVLGDKLSQTSGTYIGHLDGHPAGFIQNYKEGTRLNWKSGIPAQALTADDRARLTAEAAGRQEERQATYARAAAAAAITATFAWDAARPAGAHPYLDTKGIPPGQLRTGWPGQTYESTDGDGHPKTVSLDGKLIVPMRDIDGTQWSMQTIDPNGMKSYLKGGRKDGCHALLGEITADTPIIIVEGYATGATIHQLTSQPVIVAFDSGNIAPVAHAYRERHPHQTIIIAGDNDHQKAADKNIGLLKAEAAAVEVGGFSLIPNFAADDLGTDWNDYQKTHGSALTAQVLETGIRSAKAQGLAATLHTEAEQLAALAHSLVEEQQQEEYAHRDVVTTLLDREEDLELSRGIGR